MRLGPLSKMLSICKSGVLILFILLIFKPHAKAQDSILFLNGAVYSGKILEDLGDYYKMELKKEGKRNAKVYAVDKELIFKVRRNDTTLFLYQPDSGNMNDLSIAEMERYVKGEQAAIREYRPWVSPATVVITSLAGAYLGFWGFILPATHLGIQGLYSPKMRALTGVSSDLKDDEFFILGYRDAARKIRNKRMARTAVGGLVTGWAFKVISAGLH
jgi:hypothetical protein